MTMILFRNNKKQHNYGHPKETKEMIKSESYAHSNNKFHGGGSLSYEPAKTSKKNAVKNAAKIPNAKYIISVATNITKP